jgi:hypothetical protein
MTRKGLFFFLLITSICSFGQKRTFDIQFTNLPIDSVLQLVTQKTGYYFSYNSEILPKGSKYTMREQAIDIDRFLNKLFVGIDVEHQIMNDQIVLKQRLTPAINAPDRKVFTINGQVRDSTTNEPIPGVNVFLSGTNLGGVTDLDGFYMIDRIPIGSYEVIFSHLSYAMVLTDVELMTQGVLTVNAYMAVTSRMLDTLEVVSKRLIGLNEREKYVRIFEEEFLGRSVNAQKCILMNPDVLDFIYDRKEDKLEVFALEPIVVINELLGYEITYYFDIFQKVGGFVNFHGKARFRNLKPENTKEERKWLKNRVNAYNGSFLHFRRALISDQLKKEQFRMELIPTDHIESIPDTPSLNVLRDDILHAQSDNTYTIDFDGFLMVTYRRKPDESYDEQFFDRTGSGGFQHSFIKLNDTTVVLKSNGRLEYPGMATFGYWYWERVGDILPENYYPEKETL